MVGVASTRHSVLPWHRGRSRADREAEVQVARGESGEGGTGREEEGQ